MMLILMKILMVYRIIPVNLLKIMKAQTKRTPRKRRKRAMEELQPAIPHISMKPAKIDEEIARSPQGEGLMSC